MIGIRSECWCGHSISNSGAPAPEQDCYKICPGNHAEKCGAQNRMNLYHIGTPPPPPPSACAQWCAANFAPTPGANCTRLAAKGTGPCYVCGPRSTNPHEKLCGGACSDTSSDSNNCGACGNVVSPKRMPCLHHNCSPKPSASPVQPAHQAPVFAPTLASLLATGNART
jgi:hypothetical protein